MARDSHFSRRPSLGDAQIAVHSSLLDGKRGAGFNPARASFDPAVSNDPDRLKPPIQTSPQTTHQGASTDGMVHISEIAPFRVNNVREILAEGDMVPVIVKEVDKEKGRISLSIKMADKEFAEKLKASRPKKA